MMFKKEDERQIVTTADIQRTLRTQLNYRLIILVCGAAVVFMFIPFMFELWAEAVSDSTDIFIIFSCCLYSLAFVLILTYVVIEWIWFIKEHRIISNCWFDVVEDTVERVGPEDNEQTPFFTLTRYRDVFWNSGDRMAQHQGSAVGRFLHRRYVYPVYFCKYDRAVYDTFKWKNYLGEGDKCILVIYDKDLYPGDCNIVRIYPSIMYRYKG